MQLFMQSNFILFYWDQIFDSIITKVRLVRRGTGRLFGEPPPLMPPPHSRDASRARDCTKRGKTSSDDTSKLTTL